MATNITRILTVEPGEGHKALWLTLNLALGCSILILLRANNRVLFLDTYSANLLPWLFAVQAMLFTGMSLLSVAGRISRQVETSAIQALLLTALIIE